MQSEAIKPIYFGPEVYKAGNKTKKVETKKAEKKLPWKILTYSIYIDFSSLRDPVGVKSMFTLKRLRIRSVSR